MPSRRVPWRGVRIRVAAVWRRRWVRAAAAVLSVPIVAVCFAGGYYYVSFARVIDERLHGERERLLQRREEAGPRILVPPVLHIRDSIAPPAS